MPENPEYGPKDRRLARRYPISCELQYRNLNWGPQELANGKTLNISSNGMLLAIDRVLFPGANVEVRVSWPAKLDERLNLTLVVFGEVVRVGSEVATQVAVRIGRYEFRTLTQ